MDDALSYDRVSGWLAPARRVPSPNHDARPAGVVVDAVVLHGISLPPGRFGECWIDDLFCNRLDPDAHPYFREICELKVSCHALIERSGALVQYVPLYRRAWHAGVSRLDGRSACNDFSIGVELEGTDERPYAEAQYRTLVPLLALLMREFPSIVADRVVGHCHVAPGRKTDPGPFFDWDRVVAELVSRSSATR